MEAAGLGARRIRLRFALDRSLGRFVPWRDGAADEQDLTSKPPQNTTDAMLQTVDIDHLSSAISHATAPAFMLGAVAGFLSILISRLERIVDRHAALAAIHGAVPSAASEPLQRRMTLLHHAIFFSVLSALFTAALLIFAFICALANIGHNTGIAVIFVLALALLMSALVQLAREVRIAMKTMRLA